MDDWRQLPPESLLLDPARIRAIPVAQRAAEALRYADSASNGSYDDRAFRLYAATSTRGEAPMQTIPGMQRTRKNELATQPTFAVAEAIEEEALLWHRPIEVPSDGRFRYTMSRNLLHLYRKRPGARLDSEEEVWTFPLTAPPQLLLSVCEPQDEPLLATQQLKVAVPGVFWIPLPAIIATGRFLPMQQWREQLVADTAQRNFYCFVSHRWLSPVHPDPDGAQAAMLAWQIIAHLCEAIRVASRRGLHEPRKYLSVISATIGIHGSPLAEALIINVLRFALDTELLAAAADEVRDLQGLEDYGVAAAADDRGLEELRTALNTRPVLSALAERIFVWYDFGSMPQSPRTPEDETLFRQGLQYLNAIQVMGRTAIMLDEAEDYLSRGWCTLEAVAADSMQGVEDLLVGSRRSTAAQGRVEYYFDLLLQDRPHLIWRALLDTEVFHLQTPAECLARLSLAVTDQNDVPFIYEGLVRLGAPTKIHIDPSEIVSGVFPLPAKDGQVFIPQSAGRAYDGPQKTTGEVKDLDWKKALSLRGDQPPRAFVPAWLRRAPNGTDKATCHVALCASCEGEAVLVAGWILDHIEELEAVLDATAVSVSWLAVDIAPVGHTVERRLRSIAVTADRWVLIATQTRLGHCSATSILRNGIHASEVPVFELALDLHSANLEKVAAPSLASQKAEYIRVPTQSLRQVDIPGGCFRSDLLKLLAGSGTFR
jgi:hypothetical protein